MLTDELQNYRRHYRVRIDRPQVTAIRELSRLRKLYGKGRWRKLKGRAVVRVRSGRLREAELHWYEAHGIGKKEIKLKRYLD
jgi:hypothetical protein